MKQCKECGRIKFDFQFYSKFMGLYTEEFDICKKCAKETIYNTLKNPN